MNTLSNTTNAIGNEQSFKEFLFLNHRNKKMVCLAAVAIILQFAIFKYLYPFANYIHGDSFSYIDAADKNLTINTYLIGYSKFLRLISIFAKPDIVLVAIQYLLIQSSTLFLLFTIFYFYKASRNMQIILLCFMVFNPLFLHLGNLVSSDGIFLSLSITWFTLLLWIIHKPSNKIIIWHAIVLFMSFTVRYNAMIYPFLAGLAFCLSKFPLRKKIIGMGFALFLCGWFVGITMYQYKKLTGYWQYSPFSGWQFANNAMYAYRYVDSAKRKPVPENFQALNEMVTKFYDRTRDKTIYPSEQAQASTFYMWTSHMPLMRYRDSVFKASKDSTSSELKKWATMGPLYKDYGLHLIRQYPLHFLSYFIWPNSRKYFAPPVEFLESYNSGRSYVTNQAKTWFSYKNKNVKTRMSTATTWILNFYPILSGIINVVILFGILYYILLKGWKSNAYFSKIIFIGASFWLLNAVFTIFASAAALRFQSFPVLLTTILASLLVDWLIQLMKAMKVENKEQKLANHYSQKAIA